MIIDTIKRLSTLDRSRKRLILMAYDVGAMAMALWAAFSTRLGEVYFPNGPTILVSAAISFAIGIAALHSLQVYRFVLRFFDLHTVGRLFFGAAIAAGAWVILVYFTRASIAFSGQPILVPRAVGFIYWGFLFLFLFMGRYVMARLIAGAGRLPGHRPADQKAIAIYGANAAGISLAETMRADPHFRLCGFIDDDPALHGQILSGSAIHGPHALQRLIENHELSEIYMAMPGATRTQRLAAVSLATELGLEVKTIPAPEEIVSGRYTVTDVRAIQVGDLLRREPVEPLTELIREAVERQSILVTGAGGSIGSEICRQVLQARPRKMVILDHSEFALYEIEQGLEEARQRLPEDERPVIVPIVGSMLSEKLVRGIIRTHTIDSIYHAAAYKHVPLLEHNEAVGVENNVLGTEVLTRAAFEAQVARFTMISTDKAVRPKSVMGASKRVAELIIQAFADQPECRTRFGIVRFGNVLDSSGSVVQRFRDQIKAGGPVTVTHRDMTRFFMSIPEATQLVLQASAMARHGEVFVLDMGEPIKISELARNMIVLAGLTVRDENNAVGDIEIKYVGLRPGEKLYEELFVGEETLSTIHPRIRMAREPSLSFEELGTRLEALRLAVHSADAGAVRTRLGDMITLDEVGADPNEFSAASAAE